MLAKNTAFLSLDSILNAVFALGISAIITNQFGLQSLGLYATLVTISSIALVVLNFATQVSLKRELVLYPNKSSGMISDNLSFRLVVTAPLYIIACSIYWYFADTTEVLWLLLHIFNLGLIGMYQVAFTSLQQYAKFLYINLFSYAVFGVAYVVFEISTPQILYMILAIKSTLVLLIINLLCFRPQFSKTAIYARAILLARQNAMFMFAALLELLILRYGILFLSIFSEASEVGLYSLSSNIFLALLIVPMAFIRIYYNRYLAILESDDLFQIRKDFSLVVVIVVLASIFIYFVASSTYGIVIPVIFGDGSEESLKYMLLLIIYLPIVIVSRLTSYMLSANNFGLSLLTTNGFLLIHLVVFSIIYSHFGSISAFVVVMIQGELLAIFRNLYVLHKLEKF